jgi:malonate transporter and related proteins
LNGILTTVLPVFGLIVLGYGAAWAKIVDAEATRGLSIFVFNVAIPALLFKTTATMDMSNVAPWNLWGAYFGGLALAWILAAFVARRVESLNEGGGAVASMTTGFGNLAMLGTPLALSHFGQQVGVPLGIILSVHAPILWTAATLHREIARHSGNLNWSAMGRELFTSLSRNAIVISLLVGAIWRALGLSLPAIPDKMLTMLADASVPTALLALGASLAGYSLRGSVQGMFTLIGLKMVAMPLFVFVLAHTIFPLQPLYSKLAVLFAAMPTGANAFLFAQRNGEAVPAVSGAVAVGTGLAAITASVLLYLMDAGWL